MRKTTPARRKGAVKVILFGVLAAAVILLAGALGRRSADTAIRAGTNEERIAYLQSLGWEVEGDFFGVDYAITKGSRTVARMEKAWPAFHDRYRLEIADPADAMAALCTVLAIDCCDEEHSR